MDNLLDTEQLKKLEAYLKSKKGKDLIKFALFSYADNNVNNNLEISFYLDDKKPIGNYSFGFEDFKKEIAHTDFADYLIGFSEAIIKIKEELDSCIHITGNTNNEFIVGLTNHIINFILVCEQWNKILPAEELNKKIWNKILSKTDKI